MGSRIITKGAGKQAGVAPAWAMSHQVALRLRDTGALIIAFTLSGVKNFYRSLLDAYLTRSVGRRR